MLHFDNHALADRSMFMNGNARPHKARIVQHFLQQKAVQTIPWPAMSPDMNPLEHVWDFIGRKINQRNPKCQNIDELRIKNCYLTGVATVPTRTA